MRASGSHPFGSSRGGHDGSRAGGETPAEDRSAEPRSLEDARRAQHLVRTRLSGRPGVRGVGLTRRGAGWVVRVNVDGEDVAVPSRVDGVAVEVRVTGRLSPLAPTP